MTKNCVLFVSVMVFFNFFSNFKQFHSIHILCNTLSNVLCGFHGEYYCLRTMYHVTSSEDTSSGSHSAWSFYNFHISFFVYLNTTSCANNSVGWSASDGQIYTVKFFNTLTIRSFQSAFSKASFLSFNEFFYAGFPFKLHAFF